jgi:hypothetical protein
VATNERLRSAIAEAHATIDDVAARVGVDRKTVERWITTGRVPHARHRWATAEYIERDEAYLWPQILEEKRAIDASRAELIALYPSRAAVPHVLWQQLLDAAQRRIDLLVYASLFLPDGNPELASQLAAKAQAGAEVRLLLGDPDSDAVALRGEEEGIGAGMAGRINLSLSYLRPAREAHGVDLRLHGTTLYNSIYRYDDDMLVNAHAFGAPAAQSIVLHFRRIAGGSMFKHYTESFKRVWEQATPYKAD